MPCRDRNASFDVHVTTRQIADTPGADQTGSLALITEFVPGAYITQDQLHIRGGHQVSWLIDGVEIPNTNIASNLGPQIDPKDIDYLQTSRGSYSADLGDRTYGVFDIAPKNGFSRDHDAEFVLTSGSFAQTDDQLSFDSHTGRFAYYGSFEGNRSGYGLSTPIDEVVHDTSSGFGGFTSLLFNRSSRDQLRFVGQLRHDFFKFRMIQPRTALRTRSTTPTDCATRKMRSMDSLHLPGHTLSQGAPCCRCRRSSP